MNAIAESYLQDVSTRKIAAIIDHLGMDQLSPSSVSRIAQDLDREAVITGTAGLPETWMN